MMDLSDSLCSVMKKKSFYILLVSLLLISGVLGQETPTITLSSTIQSDITTFPITDANATIPILTKNVTLEANIPGTWEGKQSSTTNTISFSVFTLNLAGSYTFTAAEVENGTLAVQIDISVSGTRFAGLTSQREYNILPDNEVFNTSTTLVCATSGASEPSWQYKENQTNHYINESATSWDNVTGISTLTITTTQQGYYTCTPIAGGITYTVAIFNPDYTLEVTTQDLKIFTKGIDSPQLQLLCRSSDSNIPLDHIQWNFTLTQNPFIVSTLSDGNHYLRCNRGSDTSFISTIVVQGPPTLTITDTSSMSYTLLPLMINTADITVFSQNITLQVNLITQSSLGRWDTPLNTEITTQSTTIPEFNANLAGLYKFYVINFLGNEELAIQIQINTVGSNFAELTSNEYTLLSGNNIFFTDTKLVCVTNDTTIQPVWSYRVTQEGTDSTPPGVIWDLPTGISKLDIVTTQQGYYTCTIISGGAKYNVAIFDRDVTIEPISEQSVIYTKGIDSPQLQILCTSTDSNMALDDITWTSVNPNQTVQNPVVMNSLSTAYYELRCNIASFNYTIIVQGPPIITITDMTSTNYRMSPPMNNTANITIFSQNVELRINLVTEVNFGRWETSHGIEIPSLSIVFSEFTANLTGLYKFFVKTFHRNEELAIQILINAVGSNFAELTSSNVYTLLSGNSIFYTDTTLVCVTSDTSVKPVWRYRVTQLGNESTLPGVIWDPSTGISKLDIVTTQQGYYVCTKTGGYDYTVAIFNSDITTIATDGKKYTYTRGLYSTDTQLLCTSDSNTALSGIRWGLMDNPLILDSLQNQVITLTCRIASTSILQVEVIVQEQPVITLSTTSHTMTYSDLPTVNNTADIMILSQNVTIRANLEGRWEMPDGSSINGKLIEIELFTKNLAGLYKYYVAGLEVTEVLAIQIEITAIVVDFAELQSQGEYNNLSGNEVFNTNTTLVCITSGVSEPSWRYKENQTNHYINESATSWDNVTGISTLTITTTQQGYYTCTPIAGGITYTVAIFNPDDTSEVTKQDKKAFTRGIDSPQLQLLCRSSDSNISLDDIQWTSKLNPSLSLQNPFIVNTLSDGNHDLQCNIGSDTSFTSTIVVQESPNLTITDTSSMSYTLLPLMINTADITVFSQNITLQVNLITQSSLGRWDTPLNTEITTQSTTIPEFTANLAGLYKFYVINFLGNEELAIQIQINTVGSNFAELNSSNRYALLSGNNIFYTDTTLVCVTSDTSVKPVWRYRVTQLGNESTLPGVIWDPSTGISKLDIVTTQQGYYVCTKTGGYDYTVAIFNSDITTIATDGNNYTYTRGLYSADTQLLCTSDYNTALSDIRWDLMDNNPLILDSLQNQNITLTCRIASTSTNILQAKVMVQEQPVITLSTTSHTITYSELPRDTNTADIMLLSQNVTMRANLEGRWEIAYGSSLTGKLIEIELFTINLAGLYKFYVAGLEETEILAIQIQITAIGVLAEIKSQEEYNILSGNEIFDTNTTLVCATSDASEPSWQYKENQINNYINQSSTSWDSTTGISTLTINTIQQGYYTCTPIAGGITYTVAIFNPDDTLEVTTQDLKVFTRGIDSPHLQLLCRSSYYNIPLDDIQWISVLPPSLSLQNPFIVSTLSDGNYYLRCNRGSDTSFISTIVVQGPPTLTITDTSIMSYTLLPPMNNTADITVLSQNIKLEVNLVTQNSLGRWDTPLSPEITTQSTTIPEFTANLAGLYKFYVINFLGNEELAIQIGISAIGTAIGIEKDSTITPISSNTINYRETTTLVAASDKTSLESGDVVWSYQESFEGNTRMITETSSDLNRSISKLDLNNMDGYYSVSIKDSNSGVGQYIVGIFNDELIHDTSVNKTIRYTSGIDSEELQILCIPPDDNSGLENIRWTNCSTTFPNPITLESVVKKINATGNLSLDCVDTTNDEIYNTIHIMNQDFPIIFLNYTGTKYETSGIKGEVHFDLDVPVYTQDVQLNCNRNQCRWMNDDTPLIFTNMPYEIKHLTINTDGVYMLGILNSSSIFQRSVEIDLRAIGTAFLTVENEGIYMKLENNSIINMTDTIMLACATSNTVVSEDRVSWDFQENIESFRKEEISEPIDTTGLSVLHANKPGYYYCYVKDHEGNLAKYSVRLIELTKDTLLIRKEDFIDTNPRNYVIGEALQYYYQDPGVPVIAIRWGKGVKQDDDEVSDREFSNPVSINDVFDRFGSGVIELSCFYRQSPAQFIGSLSLNMKDNENLTIQYEDMSLIFGDLSNPDLIIPQNIDIAVVTKNVTFSCNSPPCKVQRGILTSTKEFFDIIDSIRKENEGIYSLRRMTPENSYTTASIYLHVTGFIQQNITNVSSSEINDTSINISWELAEDVLPDNADQTFNITYQKDGGELVLAGVTQGQSFNITGLTSCVVYTVSVELSYAYTFEKDIISKEVMIKCPEPPLLIIIIVCVVVVLILILVVIAVILIILCIWKLRGKNDKKFQSLRTDENEPKMKPPVRSSRDFEYAQIPPPIDNLAYNPVLTESLPKFNQSASSSSRNYHNLQEVKDPRMKPIPLNMYKKTIDKLWEDENALENEYRSLGGETLRYECRFAQLDQNRIKNKYKFIYPYDTSRVVLQKVGKDVYSDYINASNIPGTYVGENFIAAQGPKVNTIQDIWRMVFEQKIVNIVMVTNCIEGGKLKCEEYFPPKEGKTNEYAQYKVKTISMSNFEGYITRVLKIESPTESKQVKHFHFTAWPDHDVPSLHDELLQFIGYVQDNITQSEAPILVHCSAGVGRTGTFITLFNLRAAILKGKPISIYYLVHEMREHRPHMVQTFRQYKFIYLAVLELLLDNTSIPADEFSSTYQNYLQTDQTGYVSVFFQQYSELNYQCEKSFEYATDNGEENVEKNPIPDIMPYDNNRVVIYSPYFECGYINASYHENNLFITTQHPTENTLLDFLQMIYQTEANLVVMLTTAKEKAKIQGNISVRKAYWPNKDVPLEVPPFQVEVVNSEKSASMVKQKIILRNLQESSERTFTHVVSTSWTEKNDPTDISPVLVLQMLLHHRQEYPNSTIIMHCTDSISKTGVMLTVYQCIREMEKTGKVDMFHTVKRLRRERMRFIPNLSQFLACFSLMNEYCSSK